MADDPIDGLRESRDIDFGAFEERVREEAEFVKEHVDAGTFDNDQTALGLEHEFYAVDGEGHSIRRVPRSLLTCLGFEKELGLHNAELNTAVQPCNCPGLDALLKEVEAKTQSLQARAAEEGIRFVSDGMWTIGPEENTTRNYLIEATHEEGLTLAINVSNAVRYHGFASGRRAIASRIDLPGVTIDADSHGPVSLTTSIQPHYQFRRAADLPEYFGIALRIAGPLLALGVNSPFLPPDLYDDPGPDRDLLLREGWVENRVPVYEGMMNPPDGPAKVRFPEDVDRPEEAVDRIVADRTIVPAKIDAGERFDDAFVHLRHKHGSYWRWVRPVFGGASEEAANVRVEFRPLPGQPTFRDAVAFVAAFAGLMTALHERDHPVRDLSWEAAHDNFYAAARDGLGADLTWITAECDRTESTDRLYADLLDAAVDGLVRQGFPPDRATDWIGPLRERADRGLTPAGWKRQHVAGGLDEGLSPMEAVHGAQRAYIDRQTESLLTGTLADWPDPRPP
jgi:hypothetical protein